MAVSTALCRIIEWRIGLSSHSEAVLIPSIDTWYKSSSIIGFGFLIYETLYPLIVNLEISSTSSIPKSTLHTFLFLKGLFFKLLYSSLNIG